MDDFIRYDYRDWLEQLRNAESLLPQDSDYRADIARAREQIENMRLRYRDDRNLIPKFDLFLDVVQKPLAETADQLQRDIQKLLDEQEFIMADEGEIPERFKAWVADYFTGLAEAEGTR